MKLGIGTVQFGLDYGISNRAGQTSLAEVRKILAAAAAGSVRLIDTACLYGSSEEVLGQVLPLDHGFDIVTKTPAFSAARMSSADARLLESTFLQSLATLRQSRVYGLLIHNADNLLAENGELLMEKMRALKRRGLVKKIGASVYTGEQIDSLLARYALDLIQLPVNILDQRLICGGQLGRLKRAGVEVHARSVFLQGLLIMEPNSLPPHLSSVKAHLTNYHAWLDTHGIAPVQAALGFVIGLKEVDAVICGVNNQRQFDELVAYAQSLPTLGGLKDFAIENPVILDPSRWPKCN